MVRKLVCSLLIVALVNALIPIGAYAEWKNDSHGWWYTEANSFSTGWKQIDNSWYYFGTDGYMQKGWIKDGAWWYYMKDNGIMATGKVPVQNKIYEFYNDGRWINNGLPKNDVYTSISMKPSEDKLKATPDFSWFNENGNTYFKIISDIYAYGGWNIDGDIYVFDENGVLQKGEYTGENEHKYLLGDDGKFIKGITSADDDLWARNAITTKSTTDNYNIKLDDSHMMDLTYVYPDNPVTNGAAIKGATVKDKTLYCKTNQLIYLGNIEVNSEDSESSSFPNLIVMSSSTDENIAYPSVDLSSSEDGFYKNIYPKIATYKAGKATITIEVNGTETSFDVVVTD